MDVYQTISPLEFIQKNGSIAYKKMIMEKKFRSDLSSLQILVAKNQYYIPQSEKDLKKVLDSFMLIIGYVITSYDELKQVRQDLKEKLINIRDILNKRIHNPFFQKCNQNFQQVIKQISSLIKKNQKFNLAEQIELGCKHIVQKSQIINKLKDEEGNIILPTRNTAQCMVFNSICSQNQIKLNLNNQISICPESNCFHVITANEKIACFSRRQLKQVDEKTINKAKDKNLLDQSMIRPKQCLVCKKKSQQALDNDHYLCKNCWGNWINHCKGQLRCPVDTCKYNKSYRVLQQLDQDIINRILSYKNLN